MVHIKNVQARVDARKKKCMYADTQCTNHSSTLVCLIAIISNKKYISFYIVKKKCRQPKVCQLE